MILALPLFVVMLVQGAAAPASAPAPARDVATVKSLYSTAAYEEAIALLASLDEPAITAEHEQYRALCYLALGRSAEAEASLEHLVRISPTFVMPEAEVSPRILMLYRDVRRRVLPGIVRERYADGKRLYDERQFANAVKALTYVQDILSDADLAYPADAFADLRQLADGFVRLAELELAQAARAAAAAAAPPPAPAAPPVAPRQAPATSADPVVTRIVIYTADNAEVTPPVELERFMPPWVPPSAMARARQEYRGELQVIIDENGRAEQAHMTRATVPTYDLALVAATRRWRFEPARREGQAVKYLLTFQVLLSPAPQRR